MRTSLLLVVLVISVIACDKKDSKSSPDPAAAPTTATPTTPTTPTADPATPPAAVTPPAPEPVSVDQAQTAGKAWVDALAAGKLDDVVALSSFPFQLELEDISSTPACAEGALADGAALKGALECISNGKVGIIKPLGYKEMSWGPMDLEGRQLAAFVAGWKADHTFVERTPDGTGAFTDYVVSILAVHRIGADTRIHGAHLAYVVEEGD